MRRVRGFWLFLLTFSFFPAPLFAQQPVIHADAKDYPKRPVALSEPVHVTLTLEGPAPLVVELPKQMLADASHAIWRIRAEGPATI
ncbi:MAG: hypothetical protein L0241_11240, partial [Planctomycetia bacterium]|nr:hypothetical protein [Planctomycetia bacterium]